MEDTTLGKITLQERRGRRQESEAEKKNGKVIERLRWRIAKLKFPLDNNFKSINIVGVKDKGMKEAVSGIRRIEKVKRFGIGVVGNATGNQSDGK